MTSKIYIGPRDDTFKNMIIAILNRGRLKKKYIEKLTDEKAMESFGRAFTASTADSEDNYERFEQIGDVTANKFIIWYSYKRFPQLDCTDGVKVVARLRINYGAKNFFAPLGEQLGFWPFISAAEDGIDSNKYYRSKNKKDLLEDTFEAFIGCTEFLLDKAFRPGVGYGIVYDILSDIFNQIDISLKYEDLYDAKTRLKETFDKFKELGGMYFYPKQEEAENGMKIWHSIVFSIPNGRLPRPNYVENMTEFPKEWVMLGQGMSHKKMEAQQKAAEKAIEYLRQNQMYKNPPKEYQTFCQ